MRGRKELTRLTDFEKSVLRAVKKIPRGRLLTYKLLAAALGRPRAFRAVGRALSKNPHLVKIPCHRVVRSDGGIGGYRAGIKKKLIFLKKEGLEFDGQNKIRELKTKLHNFIK